MTDNKTGGNIAFDTIKIGMASPEAIPKAALSRADRSYTISWGDWERSPRISVLKSRRNRMPKS